VLVGPPQSRCRVEEKKNLTKICFVDRFVSRPLDDPLRNVIPRMDFVGFSQVE